jgi:hypothetical protein
MKGWVLSGVRPASDKTFRAAWALRKMKLLFVSVRAARGASLYSLRTRVTKRYEHC